MNSTGSILIVDDEPGVLHTLTRVLRQANYDVTTATSAHEALRLLGAGKFDLIYLDIRMPEMNGLQLLKELRQISPRLPVILLTAYGTMQTVIEALRLGVTDYLIKPIDAEVLVARTRIVVNEQAIERRKRDIREKISELQTELHQLEEQHPSPDFQPPPYTAGEDRFLKRGWAILDLHAKKATLHDRVISLTPSAFDYLTVLVRHAPDVVSYETLVLEAQGYQTEKNEARELAKWHVHVLRQAIEPDPEQPQYVVNARGIGYRLLIE